MSALPQILLYVHEEDAEIDEDRLRGFVERALPLCHTAIGADDAPLAELTCVEISLVNDAEIARIHDEFMGDPTSTDVITFQHGEILVSVETARREGLAHGNSVERETLLYILHGLLHLNGHTDADESDREVMHREQNAILNQIHPLHGA